MRFTNSQRSMLFGSVAVGAAAIALLQNGIDPLRRQPAIEPPNASRLLKGVGQNGAVLPFEYLLGAFSGFRQVIAGMLWVRGDAFFHAGNYDAILPIIRMITWLDPNWLDVYATGAWHLMYNFTDTDQRSDRRYLPAGVALLNEGIQNNSTTYEMYAEAGWNNFDKIKNFDESIRYYKGALEQTDVDITRAEHPLAHAYEKAGDIDAAIAEWKKIAARHEATLNDPQATQDQKQRARPGYEQALNQIQLGEVRRAVRPRNVQPPINVGFEFKVVRVRPRVLEISGEWNLIGAKAFDAGIVDAKKHLLDPSKAKGITLARPVDGTRVEVRLQDAGYVMPKPKEFTLDVDSSLTLMQDILSTRGGKQIDKGDLYVQEGKGNTFVTRELEVLGVYSYSLEDGKRDKKEAHEPVQGVSVAQAIAANLLSPAGIKQIEQAAKADYVEIRGNKAILADLDKKGYMIATKSYFRKGAYRREIDMSKDPGMYSFSRPNYDLLLSVNPRTAPGFVQDRIGWNGEGLTGKYVLKTNVDNRPLNMIFVKLGLTKEEITGSGEAVLIDSKKGIGMNKVKAL